MFVARIVRQYTYFDIVEVFNDVTLGIRTQHIAKQEDIGIEAILVEQDILLVSSEEFEEYVAPLRQKEAEAQHAMREYYRQRRRQAVYEKEKELLRCCQAKYPLAHMQEIIQSHRFPTF